MARRGQKPAPVAQVEPEAQEQQAPVATGSIFEAISEVEIPSGPLGSVDVDSLSGLKLRAYALHAGIQRIDVANLTEDRLRQNIKLFIANHFELLTEG